MSDPEEYRIGEWYRIESVFLEQEQGLVGQVGYCCRFSRSGWPVLQIPGTDIKFLCVPPDVDGSSLERIVRVDDIPDDDADTVCITSNSDTLAV